MNLIPDLILRAFSGSRSPAVRSVSFGGGTAPAPVLSGTNVNPQTAFGLAPFYAGVRTLASDLAALPLLRYQRHASGDLQPDVRGPFQELIGESPDGVIDAFRFRRDLAGHVFGWGNGYALIRRDPYDGAPLSLHIQHPRNTKPKLTPGGKLYYELKDGAQVAPENMLHFAGLGFNGIEGYCAVTLMRQTVGLTIAAEQFGASFFGNGAVARGILKVKEKLGWVAQQNLRRSINEIHQGARNAHQLMILEEGMDWVANQINPDDAQFLSTRQFQVIEIARILGLPPHKLGDYSQSHLSAVEEANLDYLSGTIASWAAMFEAQYNLKLLTQADRAKYKIAHDFSALLRGNTAARGAYYQILRNLGVITTNDIRRREGMTAIPAADGGDLLLVQAQYGRLANAGQPADAAKAKQRDAARALLRRGAKARRSRVMSV